MILNVKKFDTNATDGAHTVYVYSCEVKEVSEVEIDLDFSEGFNVRIENSNDLHAHSVIQPMGSDTICVLRAFDETWANPCKIKMKKRSPPIEVQKRFVKDHEVQLQREVEKAQ